MKRSAASTRGRDAGNSAAALMKLPFRHPSRLVVLVLVGGLSGYSLVNAVAMQTGRHPAPLFASFPDDGTTPIAAETIPASVPPALPRAAQPAKRDINALLSGRRDAVAVPMPRPKQPPAPSSQSAGSGAPTR